MLLLIAAAWAVPDSFGVGAKWQAAGGGGVAAVQDASSAWLNPAGLGGVRQPTVAVNGFWASPRVKPIPKLAWDTNRDGSLDDRDPPLEVDATPPAMGGIGVQAARQLGGTWGIGMTLFVPNANLIRFATFDPSLPHYTQWANRPQRTSVSAGVGGKLWKGLSIGAGIDVLARARVTVAMTADIALAEPTPEGETLEEIRFDLHTVDIAMRPAIAPILGLQLELGSFVQALDGLSLGARYHGEVGLPLDLTLDVQGNLKTYSSDELEPYILAAVVAADLPLFDHYQPRRLTLGLAYERGPAGIWLDAEWTDWSSMVLSVARFESVDLAFPLADLNDAVIDGNPHEYSMRTTWTLRLGGELWLPEIALGGEWESARIALRAGGMREPNPMADAGDSAFLTTDRWAMTGGVGLETHDPFDLVAGAVRVDTFFQYHLLVPTRLDRSSAELKAGYPIDTDGIDVGGRILVGGLQLGLDY